MKEKRFTMRPSVLKHGGYLVETKRKDGTTSDRYYHSMSRKEAREKRDSLNLALKSKKK